MDHLGLRESITLASCAGQLVLATIALLRLSRSPLSLPLALLCLDLFAMNAADVGGHVTDAPRWIWLDATAASLMSPLALQLALAFVGRRRSLRAVGVAAWLYYGGIALACAAPALGIEGAQAFSGSRTWALTLVAGTALFVPFLVWLLVSHLRGTTSTLERARTWLFIGAYALGVVGNVSDLLANVGVDAPRLGPLGTLLGTLVLTALTLRGGLLDQGVPWLLGANAVVAAALQLAVYLAVFQWFGSDRALFTVAAGAVTLALLPALAALARSAAAHRQRLEYHATLGRFSSQMAHDLRNPLAAIKGAAQYLQEGAAQGAPPADAGEYLQLIVDQANRLDAIVADYRRLGRVEPQPRAVDPNALVEGVLAAQSLAAPPGVTLSRELAPNLPKILVDPDLVARALENLVRNGFEAMASGGVITGRTAGARDARFVDLSISDTGKGMDARAVEQAFTEFLTTKPTGSGLGLAFVRRVAEAHGGEAALTSEEGRGTTVRLRLPVAA